MLSRIFLTLALASSLSVVAAQEKPQLPVLQLQENNIMQYSTQAKLLGCGLGLLTGVACSAFENKTNSWPFSWILESTIRYGAIYKVLEFQRQQDADASAAASSVGSWVGYLGHWLIAS